MEEDFDVMETSITGFDFISIMHQALIQYNWYLSGCENRDDKMIFSEWFKDFDRYLGDLESRSDFFDEAYEKSQFEGR